jgi:hypothetical protein
VTKVTVGDDLSNLNQAKNAAKKADVVVLMAGLVATEGADQPDANMLNDQNAGEHQDKTGSGIGRRSGCSRRQLVADLLFGITGVAVAFVGARIPLGFPGAQSVVGWTVRGPRPPSPVKAAGPNHDNRTCRSIVPARTLEP